MLAALSSRKKRARSNSNLLLNLVLLDMEFSINRFSRAGLLPSIFVSARYDGVVNFTR